MIGPNGQGAIDIINTYHEQYPAFKYLMLLLKYFVRQRALNEVFTGGVSSYGLSLMVISHLQMHLSNITEKDKRTTSLGTLLLDFFGLYGVYFNYKRIGIDTTEGGSYVPNDDSYDPPAASSYKGLEGTSLMTIDPNDEYNNVTKNCWNFSGVRNAFKYAFSALTSLNHSKTEGSFLCSIIRVTQDLIERRVWVHGDEQYRSYCARNLIPYALTHQKDNWSKHLSEKQTKKKSKSKGSMRDKKISKKRKRFEEDDRDDEDRKRKKVRKDKL